MSSTSFDNSSDKASSTFNTAVIVIVVCSVLGIIASVIIAYFVLKWLQKVKLPPINFNAPAPILVPNVPVLHDSELGETMKRFMDDMDKERAVRFSPQQITYLTSNYAIRLGSGGFGAVYKGVFPNGLKVAVKVLHGNLESGMEDQQFMAEVGTIGRTRHINLVRLYGYCVDPSVKALVYEYLENGSLDRYLFDEAGRRMMGEWAKLRDVAVGVAKGIAYLHEDCHERIVHYDIKPDNILLDANFCPKVADFGLAKLCKRDATHMTLSRPGGTRGYLAPELYMNTAPPSYKCDVYSYGIMLFEILGRRHNYQPGSDVEQWFPLWVWGRYEKGDMDGIASECGTLHEDRDKAERLCRVALWCAQYHPAERPPMSTVVKMLEGEVIVPEPPNPFPYLTAPPLAFPRWSESSGNSSSSGGGGTQSSSSEITPMIRRSDMANYL